MAYFILQIGTTLKAKLFNIYITIDISMNILSLITCDICETIL